MPDWINTLLSNSHPAIAGAILAGLFLLSRSFDKVVQVLGNHLVHTISDGFSDVKAELRDLKDVIRDSMPNRYRQVIEVERVEKE
jgi:hypothetical protein